MAPAIEQANLAPCENLLREQAVCSSDNHQQPRELSYVIDGVRKMRMHNGHAVDHYAEDMASVHMATSASDKTDRGAVVAAFNALAAELGMRTRSAEEFGFGPKTDALPTPPKKPKWFARTLRDRRSKRSSSSSTSEDSHLSLTSKPYVHPDEKKTRSRRLWDLVRISGSSYFLLPSDFATGPLIIPTCLRAMAQYLATNAIGQRGIFRISGSAVVVNELIAYYDDRASSCAVDLTVRSPELPQHIQVSVWDVATALKRLLHDANGGILGSFTLFDTLLEIKAHFDKSSALEAAGAAKIRAKLIALAIGSTQSELRREVICAVFGLLSLLGTSAQESTDCDGGRLSETVSPASDLMTCEALGIVFGPSLLGGSYDDYTLDPLYESATTPKISIDKPSRRNLRSRFSRSGTGSEDLTAARCVEGLKKATAANEVAGMLINSWRDIVVELTALGLARGQTCKSSARPEPAKRVSFYTPSVDRPLGVYGQAQSGVAKRLSVDLRFNADKHPSGEHGSQAVFQVKAMNELQTEATVNGLRCTKNGIKIIDFAYPAAATTSSKGIEKQTERVTLKRVLQPILVDHRHERTRLAAHEVAQDAHAGSSTTVDEHIVPQPQVDDAPAAIKSPRRRKGFYGRHEYEKLIAAVPQPNCAKGVSRKLSNPWNLQLKTTKAKENVKPTKQDNQDQPASQREVSGQDVPVRSVKEIAAIFDKPMQRTTLPPSPSSENASIRAVRHVTPVLPTHELPTPSTTSVRSFALSAGAKSRGDPQLTSIVSRGCQVDELPPPKISKREEIWKKRAQAAEAQVHKFTNLARRVSNARDKSVRTPASSDDLRRDSNRSAATEMPNDHPIVDLAVRQPRSGYSWSRARSASPAKEAEMRSSFDPWRVDAQTHESASGLCLRQGSVYVRKNDANLWVTIEDLVAYSNDYEARRAQSTL